jgi:excisionase family DNA binding protein
MAPEPLRAAEAARRLGITTRELLVLVRERRIRYVMIDGIAHVPMDAVDEYRQARAS